MAVVQRRVFYGKIGSGDQLIAHISELNESLARFGINVRARVLSDYHSGRTDRIVAEWEMEDVGALEDALDESMGDPEARAEFDAWEAKLSELIHHAEVEHWTIH